MTEPNSEEGQEKQYREKCGFTWMRISAKWRQLLTAVDAPESQP